MKLRTLLRLLFAAGSIAVIPAFAHHSFAASYAEEKSITIQGTVVGFEFRNPHSFLRVDVPDGQGNVSTWSGEWRSGTRLTKEGFTKEAFQPGDRVMISGSPGRDPGEHRIHVKFVRHPDGSNWNR